MKWHRKRYTVYLVGGALLSLFPSPSVPLLVERLEKAGTNVPDLPKKRKKRKVKRNIDYWARYSSVTIWARVQSALGAKFPFPTPLVMLC